MEQIPGVNHESLHIKTRPNHTAVKIRTSQHNESTIILGLPLVHIKDKSYPCGRDYTAKEESSTYAYTARMLYFADRMKRSIRPSIILIISLFLVLFSVAFSRSISAQSATLTGNTGAALFFQTTATPESQEDRSEIGSTDGITLMSFAIAAIIIIPILLQKKHWSQLN